MGKLDNEKMEAAHAALAGLQSRLDSLDHGILNVSLSKRGNINNQLENYKKSKVQEQENFVRSARERGKARMEEAKRLIEGFSKERLEALAAKQGISTAKVKQLLLNSVERFGEKALEALRK